MDRITNSRIKKFQNIKSVYVHYNHPYLGYCILNNIINIVKKCYI